MRISIQHVYTNPKYSRILEWGKLITTIGSAQVLIQLIGLVSGILIIRILPTNEYALYTLANTMLGTMLVLADGGISAGVMSQGGKVWQDKERFGIVLVTGLDLRKKFAIVSLLIAVPILLYLLHSHQASWLMSAVIITSLIPAFITGLSGNLLEIAPKLHQDILPLQKNQITTNIGRLVFTCAIIFPFPFAFAIVLASGIPQIWANFKLRGISKSYADWQQQPDLIIRQDILSFVKRILPGSIYYCLSGQITIWLISIFGSTNAIAQIGALSRLSMLLSLFSVLSSTLIVPRFARIAGNYKLLLSRYLQIQIALLILSLSITTCVWFFPEEALWILGKKYSNLTTEVVLSVVNSCLGLINGISFNISVSRGWAINPLISIPLTIGAIILGVFLFDVGSVKGMLILNIFITTIELTMYFTYNILKINETKSFKNKSK